MTRADFCKQLAASVPYSADDLEQLATAWSIDNADLEGVARYAQLRALSLAAAAEKMQQLGVLRLHA